MNTRTVRATAVTVARQAQAAWGEARRRVRAVPGLATISPAGWFVLLASIGCWWLGATLNWLELVLIAATGLLTLAFGAVFTLGRATLDVSVTLSRRRVVAGTGTQCQVAVRNLSRRRTLPLSLELPVGGRVESFGLPGLGGDKRHVRDFSIDTVRRGVIVVGPATTVRGDPLGLLRRAVAWHEPRELFVYPVTVALQPFGAGLIRDLEGHPTTDLSPSDLAFHALREYVPGDDHRHIHWRSSARHESATQSGKFLVRQYLDTRRAHLAVIMDADLAGYRADQDVFEVAVSAAASVAVRALNDEIDTTVVAGEQVAYRASRQRALDAFARVAPAGTSLAELCARTARVAPDTTIAVVVTGSRPTTQDIRRAVAVFAQEVRVVTVRVDPDSRVSLASAGGVALLSVPDLTSLPSALAGGGPR